MILQTQKFKSDPGSVKVVLRFDTDTCVELGSHSGRRLVWSSNQRPLKPSGQIMTGSILTVGLSVQSPYEQNCFAPALSSNSSLLTEVVFMDQIPFLICSVIAKLFSASLKLTFPIILQSSIEEMLWSLVPTIRCLLSVPDCLLAPFSFPMSDRCLSLTYCRILFWLLLFHDVSASNLCIFYPRRSNKAAENPLA